MVSALVDPSTDDVADDWTEERSQTVKRLGPSSLVGREHVADAPGPETRSRRSKDAGEEAENAKAVKGLHCCRADVEEDKDDAGDQVDRLPTFELADGCEAEGAGSEPQDEEADGQQG